MNQMAFDRNHKALKDLLAVLFVYIGFADDTGEAQSSLRPGPDGGRPAGLVRALATLAQPVMIFCGLHRKIHALLKPVEAATRRLIVMLAATLPTPALRASDWAQHNAADRSATRGAENGPAGAASSDAPDDDGSFHYPPLASPPLHPAAGPPRFTLIDLPHYTWSDLSIVNSPLDRSVFESDPDKAFALISSAGLERRIAALAFALNDLHAQAVRLARWQALKPVRIERAKGLPLTRAHLCRISPLKVGAPADLPPPSTPKSKWREEHHVLAETHSLAKYALDYPDTS